MAIKLKQTVTIRKKENSPKQSNYIINRKQTLFVYRNGNKQMSIQRDYKNIFEKR